MEQIYNTDDTFSFDELTLNKPTSLTGGNFFIKYSIKGNPLYINPPKCSLKQVKMDPSANQQRRKSQHCDFIFSQENESFVKWIEDLETYTQKKIFENRGQWFETELEYEDIENSFTPPMRSFKSGKFYTLRTNIPNRLGKMTLKIYDEDETEVQLETITENMHVMTILEIQGIRCSARNFQIDIELKQMMVLRPVNLFDKCIFKKQTTTIRRESSNIDIEPTAKMTQNEDIHNISLTKLSAVAGEQDVDLERDIKQVNELESTSEKLEQLRDPEKESEKLDKLDKLEKVDKLEEPENTLLEKSFQELCEVDFDLEKIPESESFQLKKRNDVYYEMYRDARRKAKVSRDIALTAYLEAKRIKNTYMLEDIINSDDSDMDFENEEEDDEEEDDDDEEDEEEISQTG